MDSTQIKALIESKDILLLYFKNETCSICRSLRVKIRELLNADFPNVDLIQVDSLKNNDIASSYGVFSAPTIIMMVQGKEQARFGANMSLNELSDKIKRIQSLISE